MREICHGAVIIAVGSIYRRLNRQQPGEQSLAQFEPVNPVGRFWTIYPVAHPQWANSP